MKYALVPALLFAATAAQAIEYSQVQSDKSGIDFTYQQMGVKMDGKFTKFASQLAFDPARPTAAKATIDVDLGSIDAGSSEADQEAVGKSWFNVKGFPTARFVSGAVKDLGGNRYEVAGKLTIKGQTRDIVVPATFSTKGNVGVFDGSFTIRRGDFTIGEGSWAKFDVIANDVVVKFHIAAAPSAGSGK